MDQSRVKQCDCGELFRPHHRFERRCPRCLDRHARKNVVPLVRAQAMDVRKYRAAGHIYGKILPS